MSAAPAAARPVVWITATPPTTNGDLHVGHLAGPYVAADVLRRFLRADGHPVRLSTGMDDHQSYVRVQGVRTGHKAAEVADEFGERIAATWADAGIEFDQIARPRYDEGYLDFVQDFFDRLYRKGAIVPRTRPLPYCLRCDRWLYEAYLVGRCPRCSASSNGNACEACGRSNDCADLSAPHCVLCGEPAELRDRERLYLPLAPYADRLAQFWHGVAMPPHVRALCETMLADGLAEVAVSHPADWGVQVPVAGYEDQRIYVWFEMAPGYLWQYDHDGGMPDAGPVQFFGFDNSFFHAVLFPALFMADDRNVPLAEAFVVNEFYQLSGEKFSTSRRHAVWARDALRDAGSDVLRWHVLRDRPHGRQTSFEPADLTGTRDHLRMTWNGWLERLLAAVDRDCGGTIPVEPPVGPAWELLAGRLATAVATLREAYSVAGFDPRRAVGILDEIVHCAQDYGYEQAFERDRPGGGGNRAALAAQLAVAAALTAWAAPVMPAGARRLAALLGVPAGRPVTIEALAVPPAGTRPAPGPRSVFGG
jgi:methionyl-tRNA synthetase